MVNERVNLANQSKSDIKQDQSLDRIEAARHEVVVDETHDQNKIYCFGDN
jgi:hypothetical protein